MSDWNDRESSPRASNLRGGAGPVTAVVARLTLVAALVGGALTDPDCALAATIQRATTPTSFADVIQRVTPAVVSVKVRERTARQLPFSNESIQEVVPLERFLLKKFCNGRPDSHSNSPVKAEGSGFLVSADGYIVTNNHVIKRAAKVDVVMSDGRTLPAKIIGVDSSTDLALLKVEGANLSYVRFAKQEPRVGDWVIAIGNPFGLGETATAGIVSAQGRDIGAGSYNNFLQIDAPVNHGNSGGPAFNTEGEVVGVNTAIYSPSGGSVGISFAIPAEIVTSTYSELRKEGHVTRGAIGVEIQPVTPEIANALGMNEARGALVDRTETGSPAAKAGLAPGDVITTVDGQSVTDARELVRRVSVMHPGTNISLVFLHNGETKAASIALATSPVTADAQEENYDDGFLRLGMSLASSFDVPDSTSSGVVVTQVAPDSVASDRGINAGDVILEVNGKKVATPTDVQGALRSAKREHKSAVLIRFQSGDQTRFIAVPVG